MGGNTVELERVEPSLGPDREPARRTKPAPDGRRAYVLSGRFSLECKLMIVLCNFAYSTAGLKCNIAYRGALG